MTRVNPSNAEVLSSKVHGHKDLWKPSEPCHVGIHWIALAECCQMGTHVPGFRSLLLHFASFYIGQSSHQQHKGSVGVNYSYRALTNIFHKLVKQ